MEFFASLEDMIEADMKTGGQQLDDIWEQQSIGGGNANETTVWLNDSNDSNIPENTDPNLLVNPQTGMPIAQASQKSPRFNSPLNYRQPPTPIAIATVLEPTTPNSQTVRFSSQVDNPVLQIQTPIHTLSQPVTTYSSLLSPSTNTIRTNNNNISCSPQRNYQQPIAIVRPCTNNSPSVLKTPIIPVVKQQSLISPITTSVNNNSISLAQKPNKFPKPLYSYSCLIALALKNSDNGTLPVSEIYNFMTENFPYFKTAPDGWKNSVRHNLSLNKCFEKLDNPKITGNTTSGANKKGCLWGLNPEKADKMDDEIAKWRKKDAVAIKKSMSNPDILDLIEAGKAGCPSSPLSQSKNFTTQELLSLPVNNNNIIKQTSTITIIKTLQDQPPQLTQDDLRILGNTSFDQKVNDDILNEFDHDQFLDSAVDDVFDGNNIKVIKSRQDFFCD